MTALIERLLRKCAAGCIVLILLSISISAIIADNSAETVMAVHDNASPVPSAALPTVLSPAPALITMPAFEIMSEGDILVQSAEWEKIKKDFLGEAQIVIPKQSDKQVIDIQENSIAKEIYITVDNSDSSLYNLENVQRISCGQYFMGAASEAYVNDVLTDVAVMEKPSAGFAEKYTDVIKLCMKQVFYPEIHEYDDMYCIDLRRPQDVFEHIIVVDAGHGGKDAGCSSPGGRFDEKDCTLALVKKLKKKLDKTNIKVYYTRLDDSSVFLRPRVELANELYADMFISIHCNYYDWYWRHNVYGAEALYSSVCTQEKKKSKKLATYMLDSLTEAAGLKKREVVNRKEELYILKESLVPSAIIETAYMSSSTDLQFLTDKRKMKKIIKGLYDGIIKSYSEIYDVQVEKKSTP